MPDYAERRIKPTDVSPPVTDTRTPADRRRIMQANKRRDTGPELILRRALYAAGIRGWRCDYRAAPGRPDLAWPALKVAIFVDGAFWHGHPSRHRPGRSGKYWDDKIAANVARDRVVDSQLRATGWTVVRFWDFQVQKQLIDVVAVVTAALISTDAEIATWPHWLTVLGEGLTSDTTNRHRHEMRNSERNLDPTRAI